MNNKPILAALIATLVLAFAACNEQARKEKAEAQQLASCQDCFVSRLRPQGATNLPGGGVQVGAEICPSSECPKGSDFIIEVEAKTKSSAPESPQDHWNIAICKVNPQYQLYSALHEGDRVAFEYVDSPIEGGCLQGKYVTIRR